MTSLFISLHFITYSQHSQHSQNYSRAQNWLAHSGWWTSASGKHQQQRTGKNSLRNIRMTCSHCFPLLFYCFPLLSPASIAYIAYRSESVAEKRKSKNWIRQLHINYNPVSFLFCSAPHYYWILFCFRLNFHRILKLVPLYESSRNLLHLLILCIVRI